MRGTHATHAHTWARRYTWHPRAHAGTHGYTVHTGVHGHMWAHMGTHGHTQAHYALGTLGLTHGILGTHGHSWTHMGTQAHTGTLYTRAHMGAHGHSVHMGVHRHMWAHMGTHGHSWTHRGALGTLGHTHGILSTHGHSQPTCSVRAHGHRQACTGTRPTWTYMGHMVTERLTQGTHKAHVHPHIHVFIPTSIHRGTPSHRLAPPGHSTMTIPGRGMATGSGQDACG